MVDGAELEEVYRESLEEDIISHLAELKDLPLEKAMDVYYNSRLSGKIYEGRFGVQYLDYRVLTEILIDTESSLFEI